MNAQEAIEAWALWNQLPEPKRLHCEFGTYHVLLGTPGQMGMGAPGEMFKALIWETSDTFLEAVRSAVDSAQHLGWLQSASAAQPPTDQQLWDAMQEVVSQGDNKQAEGIIHELRRRWDLLLAKDGGTS